MAAFALDRYSPSKFLEHAESLVKEGMATTMHTFATTGAQVGAAALAGFAMETWKDQSHRVFGLPNDVVAGGALLGLGMTGWMGDTYSDYVVAAGAGVLSAAGARIGQEYAQERLHNIAQAQLAAQRGKQA